MIKHFQRFGINIDDWPQANEDGTYPNDNDGNTEKADEIDEMISDEDVDDDDEGLCESDCRK